jgi:hypothetical protein
MASVGRRRPLRPVALVFALATLLTAGLALADTVPLRGLRIRRTVSDQTAPSGVAGFPTRVRTITTRVSPPEALREVLDWLDLRGWRSDPSRPGLAPETKDGAFRERAFPAGATTDAAQAWMEALGARGALRPVFVEILPDEDGRASVVNVVQPERPRRLAAKQPAARTVPRCAGCSVDAVVDLGPALATLQSGDGPVSRGEALALAACTASGRAIVVPPAGDAALRRFVVEGDAGSCSVSVQPGTDPRRFLVAMLCDK